MNSRLSFIHLEKGEEHPYLPSGCHLAVADLVRPSPAAEGEGRRLEREHTRRLLQELAGTIGFSSDDFTVRKNEFGKPCGYHRLRIVPVSLAHSRGKIACVISTAGDVGVDLEPVERQVSDGLRERMLHRDERPLLEPEETIRIWTIKEALAKLEGRGLRNNMNEMRIVAREQNRFEAIFNNDKRAKICSFQHQNYWLAVAYY